MPSFIGKVRNSNRLDRQRMKSRNFHSVFIGRRELPTGSTSEYRFDDVRLACP